MNTHCDAKTMARALRTELARRGTALKHGECLDIVARQFGLDNWNVLTSRLGKTSEPTAAERLIRPAGWFIGGSKPQLYEIGIDPDTRHGSGHASLIRCRYAETDPAYVAMEQGFATLMQSVAADAYRGQRISLAADLRSEAVAGAATIWLRVDGDGRKTIAFDNMEERLIDGPLTGTQGWSRRRIVIDVPKEAESLNFGFYLRGSGKAWAAGFDLQEATADEVPTERNRLRLGPANLDFSETERTVAP